MEGLTRTEEEFGGICVIIYTWEGLTARDSYENYLIHIYAREYNIKKNAFTEDKERKTEYRAELERILYDGRRNTTKKKYRIAELERLINTRVDANLNDYLFTLNMERNVNKWISNGYNYNRKTRIFDPPDQAKRTEKENTEYILTRFIERHSYAKKRKLREYKLENSVACN